MYIHEKFQNLWNKNQIYYKKIKYCGYNNNYYKNKTVYYIIMFMLRVNSNMID